MYGVEGYSKVINEYCDISDRDTRKMLLSLNEADQNQILSSLTSRLYQHIVNKVDDIDFGNIPKTKGDITKLDSYTDLVECVAIINDIMVQYKQDTKPINTVQTAIKNIIDRTELFEKGFRYNIEFIIINYCTEVLSIVSSTSFLIATCIEFIKTPNAEPYQLTVDKVAMTKTKSGLLFNNLDKFNKCCANGQLDKSLNYILKNNIKNFTGIEMGVVAGVAALAIIAMNIIPLTRELIFFFYNTRTRVSDYFDLQADLLRMNAHNLQYNQSMSEEEKSKIINKQNKISDSFKKIANKLAITNKKAEVKTYSDINDVEKEKYKKGDLVENEPDSSASGSLF